VVKDPIVREAYFSLGWGERRIKSYSGEAIKRGLVYTVLNHIKIAEERCSPRITMPKETNANECNQWLNIDRSPVL